jgi:alkyl hydroperoxide reductase subunit D
MTIDQLIDTLPDYAKDLKLNYSSLVRGNTELSTSQLWGTVVASAIATRSPQLLAALTAEAAAHLTPQVLEGARAAAAVMGMNNIFYRFQHLSSNERYDSMPARLRMNVMRTHGVDAADFELWSLAVSAINGCGKCIDAHEQVLREKGISEEIIIATVRVASTLHGVGVVLDSLTAA